MRVLKINLKEGIVRLRVETLDDLWHLNKVLEEGDLVTARTLRKTTIKRGQEIGEGDRRPMILTIEVEKREFHPDSHSLRLTGPIKGGPEDVQMSSYHTIQATPGLDLSIKKGKWKDYQLERLRKAKSKTLIFICVIDREEADFAELRESGIRMLATIRSTKYRDMEKREEYHKEVMDYLKGKEGNIILAGPGFEAENILKFIKENEPGLAKRIFLEKASTTGITGVQEVLKTSMNRVLRESRIAQETELVEELLKRIDSEGLGVYGRKEVQDASKIGAVDTLLVSEEKVREFEKIMDIVESNKGRVIIISGEHESGEKLLHLGGLGALLRFRF